MLKLKKIGVAVLALSSGTVLAGTMGPVCAPGNVTVPCEKQAWDFGAQALYLQPSYNDLGGNYIGATENAAGDASGSFLDGAPDWGWGFMIEGSYHFGTGNDLNLNWYHLDDNSATNTYGGNVIIFNAFTLPDGSSANTVTIDPQWDAVNLEFGQHVDYSMNVKVRYHAGVQYARIKTHTLFIADDANPATNYQETTDATYNGFGPRVGADASYNLTPELAIYGKAATTLLAGTSKITASLVSGPINPNQTVSGSTTAIVPELEGKLGAKYTYAMPQGDLTFDVGYLWINYFNAQTSFVASGSDDSDFGLQGLYFGLKWVGSVV